MRPQTTNTREILIAANRDYTFQSLNVGSSVYLKQLLFHVNFHVTLHKDVTMVEVMWRISELPHSVTFAAFISLLTINKTLKGKLKSLLL